MAGLIAELIVLLHFAFIVFVFVGGLLVVKWWKVAFVHVPCFLWAVLIEFAGWICPLTPLEIRFREAAGGTSYTGGFVDHYIMPMIDPAGLTRNIQIGIGITIIVINVFFYAWAIARQRKKRRGDFA